MNSTFVKINTQTWKHENQGLFDYSTKYVQKNSFKISKCSSIYLSSDCCYMPDPIILPFSTPLINVTPYRDTYQISLQSEDPQMRMWMVVRYTKFRSNGYKLLENDCIKLGKVKLIVRQINTQCLAQEENILKAFYDQKITEKNCDNSSEQEVCRICLSSDSSDNNPLVSPCKCSGSMSQVHIDCLKHWLKNKIFSRVTKKAMTFYAKDLICELCKDPISPVVVQKGKKFSLVDFNAPANYCYLVLEEYSVDRNTKNGIHLLILKDNQSLVIGRSQECDLKINDITVSRQHCSVIFNKSGFYLQDKLSKFGTLIKMHSHFKARKNLDLTVQIDRSMIRILVKEPWSLKKCCGPSSNKIITRNSCNTLSEGLESINEGTAFVASRNNHNSNLN